MSLELEEAVRASLAQQAQQAQEKEDAELKKALEERRVQRAVEPPMIEIVTRIFLDFEGCPQTAFFVVQGRGGVTLDLDRQTPGQALDEALALAGKKALAGI